MTGALSPVRRNFSPPRSQPQFLPAPVGCMRLLPSASPAPVPAWAGRVPAPCVSPRPSQRMSTIQNLKRSLIRDWRSVCSAAWAVVLGAEPAPFPSLLPPVSGGAGPVDSLRALLWTSSVPLFCERLPLCSSRLILSLSFAVPQFKLVSHKSSLRLSSGHSGPVLTLSNAACSSPFHPSTLAGGRCGHLGYFSAGSCF